MNEADPPQVLLCVWQYWQSYLSNHSCRFVPSELQYWIKASEGKNKTKKKKTTHTHNQTTARKLMLLRVLFFPVSIWGTWSGQVCWKHKDRPSFEALLLRDWFQQSEPSSQIYYLNNDWLDFLAIYYSFVCSVFLIWGWISVVFLFFLAVPHSSMLRKKRFFFCFF